MSAETTYRCDVVGCGKVKGTVNHWWCVWRQDGGSGVIIKNFDPHTAEQGGVMIGCGKAHMHQLVDQLQEEIWGK